MSTTETSGFGTADDLAAWLGITLDTPQETAQAQAALDAAVGTLRAMTGQHLDYVADDQILLDWRGERSLYLPELPVTEVAAVEARAATPLGDPEVWTDWPADQLQWSARTGELRLACAPYGWSSPGWPATWGDYPGVALRAIRVTYSHGLDPVPPELLNVAYAMAGRLLAAPSGEGGDVVSETIGDYSYSTGGGGGPAAAGSGWSAGLTGPEAAVVARYRTVNRA